MGNEHLVNIISAVFAGIAAIGAIWSAVSARNSDRHAKESARAAADSAQIARDALDLEREKYSHEVSESEQAIIEKIVEDGISLFKEKGHRVGMKRWLGLYPDLMSRENFIVLFKRVLGATGNSPLGATNLLELYKKEGIIS